MQREFAAFLWDIRQAAEDILALTVGKTEDDYLADRFIRLAVERSFEIIGEAITQSDRAFPGRLPLTAASSIVAFRNRLAHGYHAVDDVLVWRIIEFSLPQLLTEVKDLTP